MTLKKLLLSAPCLVMLISCSPNRSVTLLGSTSSTPVNIHSKTIITSEIVELGTEQKSTARSPLQINLDPGKELIIQCKTLIVNQDIEFTGANAMVTIEYSALKGNNYNVNADLGANGVFKITRKKL
jgi:hypothetical protein